VEQSKPLEAEPLKAETSKAEPKSISPMQSDMFAQGPSQIEIAISELAADDLTPRQALEEIYRLKSMLR
jgi:DNA mismatch repair protein MutS